MRAVHVEVFLETLLGCRILETEGAAGLLHTLAFTTLLTWSPGVDRAQGSRFRGHCPSQNPLLHPGSLSLLSPLQSCPILCPLLTPS